MKNYRVVLKDRNQIGSASNGSSASEPFELGLVSSGRHSPVVRLARLYSPVSGWELSWGRFFAMGVAVAGLVAGPLSGNAEASVATRITLPEAERICRSHDISWESCAERDSSTAALEKLGFPAVDENSRQWLAGPHANNVDSPHNNTGPHTNNDWDNHTNGSGGHTNTGGEVHSNTSHTNGGHTNGSDVHTNSGHTNGSHENSSGGHTNSNGHTNEPHTNNHNNVSGGPGGDSKDWVNHINSFGKGTQFSHVNAVDGDYIF